MTTHHLGGPISKRPPSPLPKEPGVIQCLLIVPNASIWEKHVQGIFLDRRPTVHITVSHHRLDAPLVLLVLLLGRRILESASKARHGVAHISKIHGERHPSHTAARVAGSRLSVVSIHAAIIISVSIVTTAVLAGRHRPTSTTCIGGNASTHGCGTMLELFWASRKTPHTFGGNASTDLNVWLFNHHELLDWKTAGSTVFGRHQPLAVGIRQTFDGNDTDTSGIVTAVTWSKANTPFGLHMLSALILSPVARSFTYTKLRLTRFVLFQTVAGTLCISTIDHLHESVTFVHVDNAGLNHSELVED